MGSVLTVSPTQLVGDGLVVQRVMKEGVDEALDIRLSTALPSEICQQTSVIPEVEQRSGPPAKRRTNCRPMGTSVRTLSRNPPRPLEVVLCVRNEAEWSEDLLRYVSAACFRR